MVLKKKVQQFIWYPSKIIKFIICSLLIYTGKPSADRQSHEGHDKEERPVVHIPAYILLTKIVSFIFILYWFPTG